MPDSKDNEVRLVKTLSAVVTILIIVIIVIVAVWGKVSKSAADITVEVLAGLAGTSIAFTIILIIFDKGSVLSGTAVKLDGLQGDGAELATKGDIKVLQDVLSEIIDTETAEIDTSINDVNGRLDLALRATRSVLWDEYLPVLQGLRGDWLEFIPKRSPGDSAYTVASFGLDDDGKHSFSGRSMKTDGTVNYYFDTIKLIPPIRIDSQKLAIYYIYQRYNAGEDGVRLDPIVDGYGFGKLLACRLPHGGVDEYQFVSGFFFNEVDGENGRHEMTLMPLDAVMAIIQLSEKSDFATKHGRALFLKDVSLKIPESHWYERKIMFRVV